MSGFALNNLALAALGILASAGAQAESIPDYPQEGASVELRFLDAPADGAPVERAPTLHMSFGGESVRAIMDTGSTGILVSASAIPDIGDLPSPGPGELTYTSSGRIMRGVWVTIPVRISGRDGGGVTTRPMPVLAVTRIDCLDNSRDCTPTDAPRSVAMMGVGFAREAESQRDGTPDKNPFLNVDADVKMRRGYIIGRQGVRIGLTAGAAQGFSFVKLERNSENGDWQPLPACIRAGGLPEACGSGLIDTGVTAMFLTLPAVLQVDNPNSDNGSPPRSNQDSGGDRIGQPELIEGTRLDIRFGGADGPSYAFSVGVPNEPAAPQRIIRVGGHHRPTFVNTGVRLLNRFDYLFDADGGYVGFRPASLY